MTFHGKATFGKDGRVTKVMGTYVYHIHSDIGGVPNGKCFGNGTFRTGRKAILRNFSVDASSSYTLFQQTSLWVTRTDVGSSNYAATAITYGDFDQDGDVDVFTAFADGTPNLKPVKLYLNDGNRIFSLDTRWFGGTPPTMV